jgi:hypothetical protein
MRKRAASRAGRTSLLDLPEELLPSVITALPAEDQRSLAGTCSSLRALVLKQAERLTLQLISASDANRASGATSTLLAAIRRQHGGLHLKLRLSKQLPSERGTLCPRHLPCCAHPGALTRHCKCTSAPVLILCCLADAPRLLPACSSICPWIPLVHAPYTLLTLPSLQWCAGF